MLEVTFDVGLCREPHYAKSKNVLAHTPRSALPVRSSPAIRAPASEGDTIRKQADEVKKGIAAQYDQLEMLYKDLHTHPELSLHEVQTAARLAKEIRAPGL